MTTLTDPAEVRRLKEEALRDLVHWLTRNAKTPERIFQRVQSVQHGFQQESQREKQRQFAERLGISKPRASAAIIEAEAAISQITQGRYGDSALAGLKDVSLFLNDKCV